MKESNHQKATEEKTDAENEEPLIDEPLLIVDQKSSLSEYIDRINETSFKKRFDEQCFVLLEVEEDLLLESLQIKNYFNQNYEKKQQEELIEEFPLNLFRKSCFESKRVFVIAKFHQSIDPSDLTENDTYELMGKFFPAEGGLVFETKLINNMKGVLSYPLLQTIALIDEEFSKCSSEVLIDK